MKLKIIFTIVITLFTLTTYAGTWTYSNGDGGVIVHNGPRGHPGTTHVNVKNVRQGRKLAKKLNKIAEEDQEGFMDNGDCPEGVLC